MAENTINTEYLTPLRSFIALDLETTGLDFEKDRIIEIAMVRFVDGVVSDTYDTLIHPEKPISDFISRLTGIQGQELESAPLFKDKATEILDYIGDLPVVAHNAMFDSHFFTQSMKGICAPQKLPLFFDSLLAARIAWPEGSNHRLETLVERLQIQQLEAHRALPDAQACGEVFIQAQQQFALFSKATLAQLAHLAQGSAWSRIFSAKPNTANDFYALWEDYHLLETPAPQVDSTTHSATHQDELPMRIEDVLGNSGPLATQLPGFVARKAQQDMARGVDINLQKGGVFIAEAGTGTGKGLAYVLAAARHLVRSPMEKVVISTATRALQQQLWQKEIPLANALFGEAIKPAILKGRRNYICLRKFKQHVEYCQNLLTPEERLECMPLVSWLPTTYTGDAQENLGFNFNRHQVLWNKLCSDSVSCTGDCGTMRSECFSVSAKKLASRANLLLINHSLFFQDMALEFSLLPAYNHIIFDEAHRLPDMSSVQQGRQVWFFRLRNILQLLVHPRHSHLGLLNHLLQQPLSEASGALISDLRVLATDCEKELHRLFLKLGRNAKKKSKQGPAVISYQSNLSIEFNVELDAFVQIADSLTAELQNASVLQDLLPWQKDLRSSAMALSDFCSDLRFLTKAEEEDYAYWLEEAGNPHTLHIKCIPVDSGEAWAHKLYPWIQSVTFTSATLAVKNDSSFFQKGVGLHLPVEGGNHKVVFKSFPSPFDSEAHMQVFIADFLPKPNEDGFQKALEDLLVKMLPATPMGSLVLFTSIQSLEGSYKALAHPFEQVNRQLLAQHIHGNFDNLLQFHAKEPASCTLGTQVFWEGIDLPGRLLELLVIPKLPFPAPGEPLLHARSELLKTQGVNAFKELHLPMAQLALKQGMGRLLRSEEDHGIVLILDKRVVTEGYGRNFSSIWNQQHTVFHSAEVLIKALQQAMDCDE
jgi:predicted DnaQ family exonuclease/DinG family helicase